MRTLPSVMASAAVSALSFEVVARCPVTKARVARMRLPHHVVDTPVFMPVGTQGALKGMTPQQLEQADCQIMLGNTYHLGNRPVSAREGVHNLHCSGVAPPLNVTLRDCSPPPSLPSPSYPFPLRTPPPLLPLPSPV